VRADQANRFSVIESLWGMLPPRNAARVRCIANPSEIGHARLDVGFRVRGQAIVETRAPPDCSFGGSIAALTRPADPCSHVNMIAVKMECISGSRRYAQQSTLGRKCSELFVSRRDALVPSPGSELEIMMLAIV
jgi:hypothetical protein